jgi:hypothetical protein
MHYIALHKKKIIKIILCTFAGIGAIFVGVFCLMQLGWLNVRGSISERNSYFNYKKQAASVATSDGDLETICKINVLSKYAPLSTGYIYKTLARGGSDELVDQMIRVASKRFEYDSTFKKDTDKCTNTVYEQAHAPISAFNWADTDEWALMRDVFTRDQDVINKAAKDAHVSPRMIIATVIGEQFRFFSSKREVFKSYFEPMKILASLSQTSYGIAGLKPKTIGEIEANLKDTSSPFYPGKELEHVADYAPDAVHDDEMMNRITNTKDPYYSYLYVGLYLKEVQSQWQKQGFDVSKRPEVLGTLYNLGFFYSKPNATPAAGGTLIHVNNTDYVYGDLAYEFYYSGELGDLFPIELQ